MSSMRTCCLVGSSIELAAYQYAEEDALPKVMKEFFLMILFKQMV